MTSMAQIPAPTANPNGIATGTAPQYADRAAMEQIVANAKAKHHGLAALIHEIIASPLFLNQ